MKIRAVSTEPQDMLDLELFLDLEQPFVTVLSCDRHTALSSSRAWCRIFDRPLWVIVNISGRVHDTFDHSFRCLQLQFEMARTL